MANPAFGSPEFRAKYGKPKAKIAQPKSEAESKAPPYLRNRKPQRTEQPIGELAAAITNLERAVEKEPEPEDKATLNECLANMQRIQAKNKTE